MTKKLELTGQKFNKLTVLREGNSLPSKSRWICKCECGKIKEIVGTSLKNGKTKSCGCLANEFRKIAGIKHGQTKNRKFTKEYQTWCSIKDRIKNPKHNSYKLYINIIIKIEPEWINNFENFLNHVGKAPSKKHTLDRIDNCKGYVKNNLRWVYQTTQIINQKLKSTNTSGYKGVNYSKQRKKWRARIWINKKETQLGLFNTIEEAINARKTAEEIYYKPLLNQK